MTKKAASKKKSGLRVLSSKTVFNGKIFSVTSDEIVEPSGIKATREVVRHSGSVVVIAADTNTPEPKVLLIRQFRLPARRDLWELPAGRIDGDEQPLAAAKRELIEETGIRALQWKRALFLYPSPGFLDETMNVFLATELTRGEAQPEEDEKISLRFFPLSQAVRMCINGAIQDGKTVAGVLWLDRFLSGSDTPPREKSRG